MRLPGNQVTIPPACPSDGVKLVIIWLLIKSQAMTVPSNPPVAIAFPSGLHATENTSSLTDGSITSITPVAMV
jgi:hypothetical protein